MANRGSTARICFSLAILDGGAYTAHIRIVVCLVDRAEPAPLPKTSLKSDQARAKVVRAQRAFAHLGEVKWLPEQLSGSTQQRASASFSLTTAATTCSCISA